MTVYDIDGARYDYTSDGNGNWIPPAGVHTILQMGSNPMRVSVGQEERNDLPLLCTLHRADVGRSVLQNDGGL